MPLDDLEKDLYDSKSGIDERDHEKSSFDVEKTIDIGGDDEKFQETKENWDNKKNSGIDPGRKRVIVIGGVVLGVILMILGITVAIIEFRRSAFSQSRVNIAIEGNTKVKSGEDYSYFIKYENNNRVTLENVEIILNHSENFYPNENDNLTKQSDRSSKINVENLKAKEEGQIEITGKFYAAEDYTVYLQPVMTYTPSNSSSEFPVDSQIGVVITTSPINLEIKAPKEALDEATAEYEIKYKNTGTVSFDNLNLRLEYSDGFIFQGATPSPIDGDNVWHIGELGPGKEGSIIMQGKINGNSFDVKSVKATVYRNVSGEREIIFGKAEELTKVVIPPLAVSHKIDDQSLLNINSGDPLTYKINYANNGETSLRDIIIKLKIDSPIIDFQKLSLKSGAYESSTKTITWKASDIVQLKNLEPGDSGYIELIVPIKERIEVNNKLDKNFLIESIVTIDSSDIAFHSLGASKNISNKVVAKLNSKVILEQQAFYNDAVIENSGPIPPKVGEETSYAVHWKITNVSNDISDVKVKAFLPTWVKWKGKVSPENEDIELNDRTHEITWNVGSLNNAVGILNDPREVVFQVSVLPEINQVNDEIALMSKIELTAKDDFTDNSIREYIDIKTTKIEEDTEVGDVGYSVVQ